MNTTVVLIIEALLISVIIGASMYIVKERKKTVNKKVSQAKAIHQKMKQFKFFYENPFTRGTFRKIVERMAGLSIYDMMEVRMEALKYYKKSLYASIAVLLVGVIFFRDITATLFVILFVIVLKDNIINKRLDEIHFIVLQELSDVLASIDMAYMRTGDIGDAIEESKKGKYIAKSIDKIHGVLVAVNCEEKLEEFYRTVPFHQVQTFAGVCYLLHSAGDEQCADGTSAFQTSISLLKSEVDLQIRYITKQRIYFQLLDKLTLAPLLLMGPLEWFFTSQIPGTAAIYNGLIGYILQTVCLLGTTFSYYYVATINNVVTVRNDDRAEFMNKIVKHPRMAEFVKNILPKKAATRAKFAKLLKGALSQKTLPYIYTSKVVYSAVVSVAVVILLTIFTYSAKEYVYSSIIPVSFTGSSQLTVDTAEKLHALDAEMMALPAEPRERDLQIIMDGQFKELTAMDKAEQIDRIVKKYNSYHALGFKWYYIIIGFGAGVGAWFLPEQVIRARKKLVANEAEEDIMQLQTMLSIIMYTNLDTLDVLWWLGKQSRIHKDAIMFAYHEYPSDPEKALNRLRDKSTVPAFDQIIEGLLSTVSHRSFQEAFHTLISQREHMMGIKEMVQEETVERRRTTASMFAKIPLYLAAIGYTVLPVGILGVTELVKMFSQFT